MTTRLLDNFAGWINGHRIAQDNRNCGGNALAAEARLGEIDCGRINKSLHKVLVARDNVELQRDLAAFIPHDDGLEDALHHALDFGQRLLDRLLLLMLNLRLARHRGARALKCLFDVRKMLEHSIVCRVLGGVVT